MGDRAGSLPNYATINGKVSSSPVASGMSSPSGGSTVSFSHTLPDFSKYSMPGGPRFASASPAGRPNPPVRVSVLLPVLASSWRTAVGGSLTWASAAVSVCWGLEAVVMGGGYGGCAGRDEAVGADDGDGGEKDKDDVLSRCS